MPAVLRARHVTIDATVRLHLLSTFWVSVPPVAPPLDYVQKATLDADYRIIVRSTRSRSVLYRLHLTRHVVVT